MWKQRLESASPSQLWITIYYRNVWSWQNMTKIEYFTSYLFTLTPRNFASIHALSLIVWRCSLHASMTQLLNGWWVYFIARGSKMKLVQSIILSCSEDRQEAPNFPTLIEFSVVLYLRMLYHHTETDLRITGLFVYSATIYSPWWM